MKFSTYRWLKLVFCGLLAILFAVCSSLILKNELPMDVGHAVIALGYGTSSSDAFGNWQKAKLEISRLIIYEHGLVIRQCGGAKKFCWTTISPERVNKLIADLASRFHIQKDCAFPLEQPYGVTGPTVAATMVLRTHDYCGGRLYFGTYAPVLDEFTVEISSTEQIYVPQQVSVVVQYYDLERQEDYGLRRRDIQDIPA